MRTLKALAAAVPAVALAWLSPVPALAQSQNLDSPTADPAHHKVEFENEHVRVVRYVIPPHEKTTLHNHPNLVNVPLTDANAKSTTPDGKTSEVHGKAGAVAWRGPVVHVFENVGDQPIEGILVEPKGPGNPAWTAPARDSAKVDAAHHKVEIDNEYVRVERYAIPKGEKAPMHDHATNVQVALTNADTRVTTPDGKTTESHAKAGEARYRPALTHQVDNIGDRYEGVLVVLKGAAAKPAAK
jgi:beta-alanine degradation protein BauB